MLIVTITLLALGGTAGAETFGVPMLEFSHWLSVESVAFSPSGSEILTGADVTAYLWSVDTGTNIRSYNLGALVESVTFSQNGNYVLVGGGNGYTGTAKIFTVGGSSIMTFHDPDGMFTSVVFSPDCTKVLTGCKDGTATLWNASTGVNIHTFDGYESVESAAFSPDGTEVLTGGPSWDGTSFTTPVKRWNVSTGALIQTYTVPGVAYSMTFSPDGTQFLVGLYDGVMLFDKTTGAEIRTFAGHTATVRSVAFSPDGTQILTGSDDDTAKLWDTATGTEIRTFAGHTSYVNSVAFSPDGAQVLTGSKDYTAMLWWVEDPPPVVITRYGSSPTDASVLMFTLTFSTPVTGVDISDFVLTTTGEITSGYIASVTGSGRVYTITVVNVEGEGTIRLDLIDDDSIVDGSGDPLGGPGIGNGNFTDGEVYEIVLELPLVAWPMALALLLAGLVVLRMYRSASRA